MRRRSLLQFELLAALAREPAHSVADLACRVARLRPSVSRSLHLLRDDGLVTFEEGEWRISEAGREQLDTTTDGMEASIARAKAAIERTRVPFSVINPNPAFRQAEQLRRMLAPLEQTLSIQRTLEQQLTTPNVIRDITRLSSIDLLPAFNALSSAQAVPYLNQPHLNALNRVLAPLSQAQMHNAAFLAEHLTSMRMPGLDALARSFNVSFANALEDSMALRSLTTSRHSSLPLAELSSFPPISVHFPAISTALLELSDLSRKAVLNLQPALDSLGALLVPPVATAAYARSLRLWIEEDAEVAAPEDYPFNDVRGEVRAHLSTFGTTFVEKHEGAWNALEQRGADHVRHAAVSQRELIRTVFKRLVPDEDLADEEGRVRLKARVRHLLGGSESGSSFALHLSLGLDEYYNRLNAYTHGDAADVESLRAMMIATDGLLLFVFTHLGRLPDGQAFDGVPGDSRHHG